MEPRLRECDILMSEHICSNNTCLFVNRDGTIVCRVTGKCHSQFICSNEYKIETNDLFNNIVHKSSEIKQNKKNDFHAPCSHDTVKMEVEKYVRLLLYSKIRDDICRNSTSQPAKKKQKRHYKKRRKVDILEFNQNVFDEICGDVSSIIIQLLKQEKSAKVKPMIIALLFLKQHGKEYKTKTQDTFIIKRSEYLYQHLPSVSDLHLFSVQKNLIRIGSNTIQKIIRNI